MYTQAVRHGLLHVGKQKVVHQDGEGIAVVSLFVVQSTLRLLVAPRGALQLLLVVLLRPQPVQLLQLVENRPPLHVLMALVQTKREIRVPYLNLLLILTLLPLLLPPLPELVPSKRHKLVGDEQPEARGRDEGEYGEGRQHGEASAVVLGERRQGPAVACRRVHVRLRLRSISQPS